MVFGEIVFLKELSSMDPQQIMHKHFRVTGVINFINAGMRNCQITHKNYSLIVDLSVVDFGLLRLDTLCQFIGQIVPAKPQKFSEYPPHPYYFEALVIHIVEGLDLELFERTILARRRYFAARDKVNDGVGVETQDVVSMDVT